jgi:biotin transport system substrate-specific component
MSQVTTQTRRAAALHIATSLTARRTIAIAVFVVLTAISARLSVPLPGMVPVSMQTLVVLLAGMLLGPALGASAMTAYLLAGMAGLPVFVAGGGAAYLAGPTGGFLLAFPAAAAVTGALASRLGGTGIAAVTALVIAGIAGSAVVFLGGWAQLAVILGDPAAAFRAGVLPFLIGSLAKLAVAVVIAMRLRRRTLGLL